MAGSGQPALLDAGHGRWLLRQPVTEAVVSEPPPEERRAARGRHRGTPHPAEGLAPTRPGTHQRFGARVDRAGAEGTARPGREPAGAADSTRCEDHPRIRGLRPRSRGPRGAPALLPPASGDRTEPLPRRPSLPRWRSPRPTAVRPGFPWSWSPTASIGRSCTPCPASSPRWESSTPICGVRSPCLVPCVVEALKNPARNTSEAETRLRAVRRVGVVLAAIGWLFGLVHSRALGEEADPRTSRRDFVDHHAPRNLARRRGSRSTRRSG